MQAEIKTGMKRHDFAEKQCKFCWLFKTSFSVPQNMKEYSSVNCRTGFMVAMFLAEVALLFSLLTFGHDSGIWHEYQTTRN